MISFPLVKNLLHPSHRNLWLLLASLVALHYLLVIDRSQGSPTKLCLAFLVWWGPWLCSEDLIALLQPRPTQVGLFLGSFILVLCILRGSNTVHPDGLITLLAPVEGFALSLLYVPFHNFRRFGSSLFILTLLPLQLILLRLLPEQTLSLATATGSGLLLKAVGKAVTVVGRDVLLPEGGVAVLGECNGADMISMLMIVALTFLVGFPLHRWLHRVLVIIAAPLVAMATNTVRIAMLALFAQTQSPESDAMFDFFHKEAGSLLFSGVSVSLIAMLYLALLHKQFSARRAMEG
jgi:cyanoexosortase A